MRCAPAGDRRPSQEDFVRLNKQCVYDIAKEVGAMTAVIGFVDYDEVNLFNAAAVINNGEVRSVIHKTLLPTYDVFDEHRYFTPALVNNPVKVELQGQEVTLGTSGCRTSGTRMLGMASRWLMP